MEEILATRYGDQGEDKLVGAHKQTNIFRWCVSDELYKCHIGDPDQPDIITWVTNPKEFDALSNKDLNVVGRRT